MEIFGDIERFVAQNLYPLRIPIAAAVLLLVAGIAFLAYRRRWDRVARAHPRASFAAVAVLLVVGGPLAWYLGSPLFISTRLDEAAPTQVAVASPIPTVAATTAPSETAVAPTSPPTPTPTPRPERTGTFHGADDFHFGSGTARVIPTGADAWTVRFEDFSVRNGPDLYVYLSPDADGYADGALELGRLKATDGAFNYALPAGTDPTAYRSVVVWCKQFAVQFAHATLTP
jgi:hypothetical protein